ncbi:hypothetical protein N0V84_006640 [Fusarium piperis]|uniref:Uncharacterized protein n=1 Tax=Fusarium piperis TaxID=1435070 RepID=A0A9W8WBP0_9HYPO|nr:hypothetical protein N0V84_006640 [Fusarium piperis]
MSARIETIPQDLATLCERCKVIKFVDEHLWIEESDGSLHNDPGLFAWGLQYKLDDEFPDLPILTQSAQECDFCRQLLQGFLDAKQTIQHIRGSNVPFDVRFSLKYYPEDEGDEKDEEYEEFKADEEYDSDEEYGCDEEYDSDEEYERGNRLKGLYGLRATLHAKDDLESVDGLFSIIYLAESSSGVFSHKPS